MLGALPGPHDVSPAGHGYRSPHFSFVRSTEKKSLCGNCGQADAGGGLADLDRVVLLQLHPHLAVEGEHDLLGTAQDHLDAFVAREHDGPFGQGVRAHRGEDDGVHRGKQEGPPAESE